MAFFLIIGGFVILILGANLLVRGATALAIRAGITPLVVGLTVVAFGTSSPELVVSAKAAWTGQGEIALGTVIGSNICNIVLILGLASLIRPIEVHLQVLRFDLPVMILVTLLVSGMLFMDTLSRLHGAFLLAGIICYVVWTIYAARREPESPEAHEFADEAGNGPRQLWALLVFLIVGALMLAVGSEFILKGAIELASAWGVSQAVIGLSIVAAGGSLPELATSVVAAAKGKGDIAIGNIIGSNIFNLLSVLGTAALVRPIQITGIDYVDVTVMIFVTVLLFPLMRTGFVLKRWEGAVMLVIYVGYVVYLFGWK